MLAQPLLQRAAGAGALGEAARQVGLLTARAEELAAQAWTLANARRRDETAKTDLAVAITSFSEEAVALTQRAAREAPETQALATILSSQATGLDGLGRALDGADDAVLMRARLRPILASFAAIPDRLKAMTDVATDVTGLGDHAQEIANRTEALDAKGRYPGIATVAIYRELGGFASAAGTIATRMNEGDRQTRQTRGYYTICPKLHVNRGFGLLRLVA